MPAHHVPNQNPPVPLGGAGIDKDDEAVIARSVKPRLSLRGASNPGCHCEAGAAGRSNLVTLSRRVPGASGSALSTRPREALCCEASGSALHALRDCFVALRAPRNDSRGFPLLAMTAGVFRSSR
jgi:hypothetical protein